MTSTKFSNEEMNLLNELLITLKRLIKFHEVKSMNTNHKEVGLTADMWSEQSKSILNSLWKVSLKIEVRKEG